MRVTACPDVRSCQEWSYKSDCKKTPEADIESIRSKLVCKIFDEYANISVRFNGRPRNSDPYDQTDSVPGGTMPPLCKRQATPGMTALSFRGKERFNLNRLDNKRKEKRNKKRI